MWIRDYERNYQVIEMSSDIASHPFPLQSLNHCKNPNTNDDDVDDDVESSQ